MNHFLLKFKIILSAILFMLLPFEVLAQTGPYSCSRSGYTIATVNGMFTSKDNAILNRDALRFYFGKEHNGEPLIIDFLFNPIRFKGAGDALKVAIQKSFESGTVKDYDLAQMFIDASEKVRTQKLLLVAHSQGNFYANNFYKVAVEDGGVLPQSIGVYGVATPAGSVGGNGKWLTSYTDQIIAGFVGHTAGSIMPPNTYIRLSSNDDQLGHGFREAYLKYEPRRIVQDIQWSLNRLSYDPFRDPNKPCITPPASLMYSLLYKTENSLFFAVDTTFDVVPKIAIAIKDTTIYAAKGAVNISRATIKTIGNIASEIYASALLLTMGIDNIPSNNSASVILATQPPQDLTKINAVNKKAPVVVTPPVVATPATPAAQPGALPSPQPQTVFVFEPKVQSDTNAPKLVFVGSFSNIEGGTPTPTVVQVLGTETTTPVVEEEIVIAEEPVRNADNVLVAPAVSAPQCAQTLATDGCLLATTTVHFEWSAASGADHYLLNKNGTNATTTDTTLDIEIKDFSDYTLEINSVGANGEVSATSTQKVSVATIPIAINEIAWMGTLASANDEWFEIKNNTTHTIDLSQWELNAKDGTPHVKLAGTIAPKEYLVFERTDNSTIADVDAHQTYTGALGNAGEQLNLSYASTTLDQTPGGAWAAGENSTTTRKTMERYSSRESGADTENWGTNLGDTRTQQERYDCFIGLIKQNKDTRECFTEGFIKNGTDANGNAIGGTPGERNSVSYLINNGQDITSDFTLTADEESYVIPDGGKVFVNASSTLTIEPGVTISFYGGQWGEKQILIEGRLDAEGTAENPIIFNSFFPDEQVGGIQYSAGFGTSTLSHVRFESTNGILMTDGSRLDIQDSQFMNNDRGIESDGKNTITINNTSFDNTEDEPVYAYDGTVISIASSTITNTMDAAAIEIDGDVSLTVASTTIDGVYDGEGIYAYGSDISIINSVIRNTSSDGVSAYYSDISIASSTISDTMDSGIYLYNSTSTITNTTIEGVSGYSGITVVYGTLSVASSTIGSVLRDGIDLYSASSTILNTVIENGTGTGIYVDGGTAAVVETSVAGFDESGISVASSSEPVDVSGGEITGNAIGVDMSAVDEVTLTDVSVHDNGTSEADNIVVW